MLALPVNKTQEHQYSRHTKKQEANQHICISLSCGDGWRRCLRKRSVRSGCLYVHLALKL